jgi:hypothetical protein
MTAADLPAEWREHISVICSWLADNYVVWQPFGLLLAVGMLLLTATVIVEMWNTK